MPPVLAPAAEDPSYACAWTARVTPHGLPLLKALRRVTVLTAGFVLAIASPVPDLGKYPSESRLADKRSCHGPHAPKGLAPCLHGYLQFRRSASVPAVPARSHESAVPGSLR